MFIKNFEYTTRADGGFDCTTTISSVGTDLLKKPTPKSESSRTAVQNLASGIGNVYLFLIAVSILGAMAS